MKNICSRFLPGLYFFSNLIRPHSFQLANWLTLVTRGGNRLTNSLVYWFTNACMVRKSNIYTILLARKQPAVTGGEKNHTCIIHMPASFDAFLTMCKMTVPVGRCVVYLWGFQACIYRCMLFSDRFCIYCIT